MTIRRATADDAPACATIVRRWLDASDWMPAGPTEAELAEMMRAAFPTREAWVAEEDGAILGYVSLDPDAPHVRGLYVAHPGRGIGKALLDRVKAGRAFLSLNTHAPNTAAHRFYHREGFGVAASDLPGTEGVPELRMEWRA